MVIRLVKLITRIARKASDSTVWDAATREFFEVTRGTKDGWMDGCELPLEFLGVCRVARRLVVKLLCPLHARSLSQMLEERVCSKTNERTTNETEEVLHDGTLCSSRSKVF